MLTKNPLARLCKFSHIKAHPWFAAFPWENLISLNIEVPHIPNMPHKDFDENKFVPYTSHIKVRNF